MISTDFYPAAWNDANVQASPTQLVQNIPITTPEFTQAYWLGWVAWENIPQQYKISRYNIVNGKGIFTDITKPENVPIGYNVNDDGSYVPEKLNAAILTNNGEKWQNITYPNHTTTAGNNVRLPNSLNVNTVGYNGNVVLCFIGYANSTEISGWLRVGINDFINDSNFTVTFTNGYVLTTKPSDFNDYELMEFDVNDVHYKIALGMYTIEYARDVTISGGTYGYQGIRSMLQIRTTDDKPYIQSLTYPAHYQNNYQFTWGSGLTGQGAYIDYSGNIGAGMVQNTDGENVDIMGGFVGEFEISSMTVGTIIHPEDSTFYIRGIRSDLAIIGRIFTYTEIYKTIALAPRIAVTGVNQYANNANFYYAKVDLETNEFLTDFVSGDKISELTDWQIIGGNINSDEFTEDDIPEYEPEPSGEDEESGTRIPNQFRYFTGANNFISQYAMKATQIQTFGQMLWNSWAESTTFVDAVNNFWIALNIDNFTGSFDISSVMNFIVSLKVFPFNITHFDTSIFTLTNTLRIGRGTFPFLFPSEVGNIIKVLSNIVYVDCGLIHDPTTGQYGIPRKFNDFRDYTNVSITCFCPYCGTVELNPGDVVGRQLSCKYAVDLQTGECLCLITVADSTGDLYNVAAISGNMGASIPVSATNSGLIEARRLSDAGNALGLFGGMFTENLSMGSNTFAKAKDSQSSIGAIASASTQAASNLFKDIKQTSNFAANMLSRGAIGCPMMQGGSGFAAFSQADTPYVQIRYGIYSEPANYSHSVGRISTKSDVLSSYKDSGLVICENVDVSGFTCHEDERTEIKALLESGVYL